MGRILVAGEHGNGIVDELAPIDVSNEWVMCSGRGSGAGWLPVCPMVLH